MDSRLIFLHRRYLALKPRGGVEGYAERVIGFASLSVGHAGASKSAPALRAEG